MNLSKLAKKKILISGLLTAVLVSILGNAIWEYAVRPLLHTTARLLLDAASLGLTSYKNNVYQQVAKDNHTAAIVSVQSFVVLLLLLGFFVTFAYLFTELFELRWRTEKRLVESEFGEIHEPPVEVQKRLAIKRLKSVRRGLVFLYVSAVAYGSFFILEAVSLAKSTYVESADAHYHHILRMAAPII